MSTHLKTPIGRGRDLIPLLREIARAPIAPDEESRSLSQPRGGIRIVEGGELCPSKGVASGIKGKEKDVAYSEPPSPMEKPLFPPSLEALM